MIFTINVKNVSNLNYGQPFSGALHLVSGISRTCIVCVSLYAIKTTHFVVGGETNGFPWSQMCIRVLYRALSWFEQTNGTLAHTM